MGQNILSKVPNNITSPIYITIQQHHHSIQSIKIYKIFLQHCSSRQLERHRRSVLFIFLIVKTYSVKGIIEMKDKECPVKHVYDPEILPDLLPLYYKRLFPHIPFYRWLSYGNGMCIEIQIVNEF